MTEDDKTPQTSDEDSFVTRIGANEDDVANPWLDDDAAGEVPDEAVAEPEPVVLQEPAVVEPEAVVAEPEPMARAAAIVEVEPEPVAPAAAVVEVEPALEEPDADEPKPKKSWFKRKDKAEDETLTQVLAAETPAEPAAVASDAGVVGAVEGSSTEVAGQVPVEEPLADEPKQKKSWFGWFKRKEKPEDEAPAEVIPAETPAGPVVVASGAGLTGVIEGLSAEGTDAVPTEVIPAIEGTDAAPAEETSPDSIFAWLEPEPQPEDVPLVDATGETTLLPTPAAAPMPTTVPAGPNDATAVLPALSTETFDMGPGRKKRWWIAVLIGLVVVAALGGVGYAWWWATSRPIAVPDVIGKRPAEATQRLNDLGLALGKVSEVPTDVAPAGTIISQKPKKGAELAPGGTVSFIVASSPELAKVPNVVGISSDDAAKALAENRLRPFVVESFNATVAAGFVISQIPSVGAELPPGTQVALAVSKGLAPAAAATPHTLGLPEADAVSLMQARGLTVRIYRARDTSVAAGAVLAQTPNPGSTAPPGSVAMILVSSGNVAGSTTVPNVVGSSQKEAESKLKARNLTAEVVTVANSTVPKGNVIAQMSPANRKVSAGTIIGLLVSSGAEVPGVVPSLVGTLSADASKTASAAGFQPVVLSLPIVGGTQGHVFAQYPLPGTSYSRGYPIICLVAEPLIQ